MYDKKDIIEAVDLRDVVGKALGEPFEERRDYSKWECPFHSEKTPGAFTVWEDHYYCFSCNAEGDVFTWVQEMEGMDFKEAVDYYGKAYGVREVEALSGRRGAHAREDRRGRFDEERRRGLIERARSVVPMVRRAHENLLAGEGADVLAETGIKMDWAKFLRLGYLSAKKYEAGRDEKKSPIYREAPALVFPYWICADGARMLRTVQYRLHGDIEADRYRFHADLGSEAYQVTPCLWEPTKALVVVEGVKKAIVFRQKFDANVIGVPSKTSWGGVVSLLFDGRRLPPKKRRFVLLDPDARESAIALARIIGGRAVQVPMKVDDLINTIGVQDLVIFFKQARFL